MIEEELREIARNNYAAQMEMLGYQPDGNPKDLVDVVRCKYCKHSCDYTDIYPDRAYKCTKNGGYHNDSWFCADGERKEQK